MAALTPMEAGRNGEPTPIPSEILAGKYRLISVLGEGGMGRVWRAEHLELGAPVAVKLMNRSTAGSAEALRQCQKEARAAAALRSPHVVQVLDFGMDDATGSPFIVMELLEGESLADRLHRLGKLSPKETARVLTHVARALSRAHEAAIIHRDLKPANVFLVRNADEELAKVLDFGTARVQPAGSLTASTTPTGAIIGTPYFMSPEHISGQPVDHRTDLWAMAVMTFECLTGRRPFEARDIGQLVLQICTYPIPSPSRFGPVPGGFDAWFARATRRELAQRFQSAREQADELSRLCDDRGAAAGATADQAELVSTHELPPPTGPVPPLVVPVPLLTTRRRAARWVVAAAVLAVGGAGIAVARVLRGRSAPPLASVPTATASAPATRAAPVAAPAVVPVVTPAAPPAAAAAPVAAPIARAAAANGKRARRSSRHKARPAPAQTPAALTAPPAPAELGMETVLDHRR